MKKSLLICLLATISSVTFGQEINSKKLLQLQPNTTTQPEVEKAFGKPSKELTDKDRARWNYEQDGYHITMDWSNNRLLKCMYASGNLRSEWDQKNSKILDIGADLTQVIEVLGLPSDMSLEPGVQLLRYAYQHNILSLAFREGKLLRYEMNGTVSKL